MARVDVLMPQMGESIAEGTVSKWLKKLGDPVAYGGRAGGDQSAGGADGAGADPRRGDRDREGRRGRRSARSSIAEAGPRAAAPDRPCPPSTAFSRPGGEG